MNVLDVSAEYSTQPEPQRLKSERIRDELVRAGMTNYGLRKFNSRYLPSVLASDEHVEAVIYGRYSEGSGMLNFVDRMVVATNHRVVSLNHKPGYTDTSEVTYDIIDGVDESEAGPFAAVTLNTKVSHYTIRFVNKRCARIFVQYIEKRRSEYFEAKLSQPALKI